MKTRIAITRKGIKALYSKHHLRSEIKSAAHILIFFLLIFLTFLPEIFGSVKNFPLSNISKEHFTTILGITNSYAYTKCNFLPPNIHYWYKLRNNKGEMVYFFFQDKYPDEQGMFRLIPEAGRLIDKNDSRFNLPDSMNIPFQIGTGTEYNGNETRTLCSLENDSLPCFIHTKSAGKEADNDRSELFFGYALKQVATFINCIDGLK